MAVGTTAAIIGGLAAAGSAGANIIGSKMAANASNKAAKTQADAGMRAAEDSRRASQDALAYIERSRSMPAASGTQSYLSRLLGVPQGGAMGGSTGAPSMAMPMLKPGAGSDGYMHVFGQTMPGANAPLSGVTSGPSATVGGGMVRLKAPNGMIKAVPADQAEHFLRLGAERVN